MHYCRHFNKMRWWRTLCLFTCFVFIMCPRKVRSDLEPGHTSIGTKLINNFQGILDRTKRNLKLVQNMTTNKSLREQFILPEKEDSKHEPGFDLDENEIAKFKIWPQGIIPYYIDDFSFDKVLRDRIRKFLDSYTALTDIQFIELPRPPEDADQTRWLFIINRMGVLDCVDHPTSNFNNHGVQKLVLGYDCLREASNMAGIILSLLGVPPQHNAPDRDNYVQVWGKNIQPDKIYLFLNMSDRDWLFHDIPYDFASASHYDFYAYTVNGLATITPKRQAADLVGDTKGLSRYDVKKIKMLYNYLINKKSTFKTAQCSKLYKPGAKIFEYRPADVEVTPRKKPDLYLGIEPPKNPANIKLLKFFAGKNKFWPHGFNDRQDPIHELSDFVSQSEK